MELTVVIISNRICNLMKIVNYWYKLPYNIVIADGSQKSNMSSFVDNNRVKYIWCNSESITERLIKALDCVETKYTLMVADDDYYWYSGIEACVDFLNDNDDYSAAVGWFYGFDKNNIRLEPIYTESYGIDYSAKDSIRRLEKLMSQYSQWTYCVFRTKEISIIVNQIGCVDQKEILLYEFVTTISTVIAGNVKILPVIFGARENKGSEYVKYYNEIDVIREKRNVDNNGYNEFEKGIIDIIARRENIPRVVVGIRVKIAINRYCQKLKRKQKISKIVDKNSFFSRLIINYYRIKSRNQIKIESTCLSAKGIEPFEEEIIRQIDR